MGASLERGLEQSFLAALRRIATDPAARGLADDAAVLPWPLGLDLVATHDMLVEGVHFLPRCPPADIGWKLVAINLSDLAAMGARPVAMLMGTGFGADRDAPWAEAFATGVHQAIGRFAAPLIGGDTVRAVNETVLSLTAIGSVPPGEALGRGGGGDGDELWVSGTLGDAGLGLRLLQGEAEAPAAAATALIKRYRRPWPRLELGLALRGIASAAMDVSDGLLIDAARMAEASDLAAELSLGLVPVSEAARAMLGEEPSLAVRQALATAGDDYELLFAAPPAARDRVLAAGERARVPLTRVGVLRARGGAGGFLSLTDGDVPARLGYQHN